MSELLDIIPPNAVQIPIQPVGEFSASRYANCGECPALCCSAGTKMSLTQKDALGLEAAGTVLSALGEAKKKHRFSRRGPEAFYRLESDCGNLIRTTEGGAGVCAAFDDPNRPKICGEFVVGQFNCMKMRLESGEIDIEEFQRFDAATIA